MDVRARVVRGVGAERSSRGGGGGEGEEVQWGWGWDGRIEGGCMGRLWVGDGSRGCWAMRGGMWWR